MELRRVRCSDTVTRYYVSALLGTNSVLMLVQPQDGTIVATWRSDSTECLLRGEWISPYPDLEALVEGIDLDPATEPLGLQLLEGGAVAGSVPTPAADLSLVGRTG
jgi:hypothetical protein